MSARSAFSWLAFVGALLVGIAMYLQTTSMDLSRFSFSQYLAADVAIPAWWEVVVTPLALGSTLLVTAAACIALRLQRRSAFLVVLTCALLAGLVSFFSPSFGIFTIVMLVPLAISTYLKQRSGYYHDNGAT